MNIDNIMCPAPAPTKAEVLAALEATIEVGRVIALAGPSGIPSGELYARLMPSGITLGTYERIIGALKRAGALRESNHVLTANLGGK
jgi:hypothetical protein